MNISIEQIAKICHQANKAYCESVDDYSQLDWNDAPDWQVNSAKIGVQFCIDNPGAPPSANHDSWLKVKEAEGWKYGEVKNVRKKEHPCFVPYDELPVIQKVKDVLFKNIVDALTNSAKV